MPSVSAQEKKKLVSEAQSETLIARAEKDYILCKSFVDGVYFCQTSRGKMLRLFEKNIKKAKNSGVDGNLQTTYLAIHELIQEWYFADNLRAIFSKTVMDLKNNVLVRKRSTVDHLASRNAHLEELVKEKTSVLEQYKKVNEKLTESVNIYEKTIEEKDKALKNKDASIAALTQSEGLYRHMLLEEQKRSAEKDKKIDELLNKLEKVKTLLENPGKKQEEQQKKEEKEIPRPSVYNPQFIGGSSRSEAA